MKNKNLDVRPEIIYNNYDYVDQDKSEKENNKSGPGAGLFNGKMDKYKDIKEFIDSDRKMHKKQRKEAINKLLLDSCLDSFATGIIEDVKIPEDVLEKIKKDNDEDEKEEDSIDETLDSGVNGTAFTNNREPATAMDGLNGPTPGALWDNDVNRNSYYGLYSLMGNHINQTFKIADIYYNLATSK